MVDPPVAQRRVRLVRRIPLCRTSVPGVRHLDTVRDRYVHPCSGVGLPKQLSPYRGTSVVFKYQWGITDKF